MSDFVLTRLMPPTACGPTGCQPAHAFHGLPGVLTLLGDGNDVLDLQYAPANRFYADGGAGLDKLLRTYDAPTGSFKAVGFENFVPLARPGHVGPVAAGSTLSLHPTAA
jgi:hypothetical protein